MKFEILKQSHLKRNILIGVVAALIISAVVFNFTRAKYRVTESIPLINGTITYDLADLNAVAVYVQKGDDYSKSDTIPKNGYLFNEERSYCSVNGEADESVTLSYDIRTKTLNIAPLTTKGTKCYLYIKTPTSISEILETKIFETRTNFRTTITEDTTGTIYYADTSKGKTY